MTADFFPPQQQPLLIRLVQSISFWLIPQLYRFRVSMSDDDVARLRALDNARLVYLCNHPTLEDGVAMFGLSARVGHLFHYIVARESFKGLTGKFIQAIGCYSIRRGMGDRASIAETLKLLKVPRSRLVIFPEGGCSYQNDVVQPFRSGAIQMPLQVMAQLAKQDGPLPDLYIVPVSLKYRYTRPMGQAIEQTLAGLEQALGISTPTAERYERLIAIATQVLHRLESEYRLEPPTDLDLNHRIRRLKTHVIDQCEQTLGLTSPEQMPLRERVYKIQALLDAGDVTVKDGPALYWTTVRLLNFDAIYDGYVAERPTPERFLDTLMRLEREVYQIEHIQPKADRRAYLTVGNPINVKDYLSDFRRDKVGTVERLTTELHTEVQVNLDRLASEGID
ncbi:MAG: 1-acyl-sn-glycerol-3-phosphate acyltransferase [Cyanobacteria bacterium P01_A01_bin.105]